MKWLTEPLKELEDYRYLLENIKNKNTPVLATGVIDVQKTQLIYALCKEAGATALIIGHDEADAKSIYNDILSLNEKASYFPAKDVIFYRRRRTFQRYNKTEI